MVHRLGGLLVAFLFLLILLPVLMPKGHQFPDRTRAINNAKQVGLALFEFGGEYGQFPDASTIPAVKAKTGTTLALGSSSSNQLFRQLLATVAKSEMPFWARTTTTPKYPDGVLGPNALVSGECSFTYIAGLSFTGDPATPLLMTPVIPGTWKFDPEPFQKKAVVLFIDSSVRQLPIDKHGDVILNGMNLFDPRQPHWNGKAPDIKWPE